VPDFLNQAVVSLNLLAGLAREGQDTKGSVICNAKELLLYLGTENLVNNFFD